jgi:hypothetical protein
MNISNPKIIINSIVAMKSRHNLPLLGKCGPILGTSPSTETTGSPVNSR